ncbi:hypothetical protein [Chitinophaga sp. YIM B06452]|uniref:hypothetical protein n=1 Tax=Chitinophaga sp. YIM B06452 TaxID=3082158 RepID=UPI0031FEF7E0
MSKGNNHNTPAPGTHAFDRRSAEGFASWGRSFSINIFRWDKKAIGKGVKPSKCIVRILSVAKHKERAFSEADKIVRMLDNGEWDGRKTVSVK